LTFAGVACGLSVVLGVIVSSARSEDAKYEEWKAPARAARKKNPVPADEKSLAAGKAIYAKECLSCHGTEGRGDGPAAKELNPKPRDLRTPKIWEQTDGSLFWKLTEGKKPMPTYEKTMSEDDRWNVINYTRATFGPADAGTK
jgi:mono/diheme cytochrome c family protein